MSNLRMRVPPTAELVACEAAARLGSFTRAAEELCITQAAISRTIRELERRLTCKLFKRHRYDVSLTEEGERFVRTVRPALRQVAEAADELRQTAKGTRELVIFSDLSIDRSYLLPRLSQFLAGHPEVELKLLSSSVPIEQINTRFDIGFQNGNLQLPAFDSIALADDEVYPVCSPAFAAAQDLGSSLQQIAASTLLYLEQPDRAWIDWAAFLERTGIVAAPPKPKMIFSSYPTLLQAAENGEGIALGWDLTVRSRLEKGTLQRLGDAAIPVKDSLRVYFPRGEAQNPVARAFVTWLLDQESKAGA